MAPEEPVHLSGSQLASVLACPRHWFLARKAQGESVRTAAASFGSVVHVLAEYGAHSQADHEELSTIWSRSGTSWTFDAHWLSAVERVEAESALERFVTWQEARSHLTLLGTEVEFSCDVDLGSDRVHLTGSADRVERDPDGRIRIVDFKTSKTAPTAADVALHDQLGVYQLAVQQGAFAGRSWGWRATGRRRTGVPPAARRRQRPSEDFSAGLAGRCALSRDAAGAREEDALENSRPGCIGGWRMPRTSFVANIMTLASARLADTVPSARAVLRSRLVNRWCGDRLHPQATPARGLGLAAPPRSSMRWASPSPPSSWMPSPRLSSPVSSLPAPDRARPPLWRPGWSGWLAPAPYDPKRYSA